MTQQINSSILAGWHADPLTLDQAQDLLHQVQGERKNAILKGESCCMCQLNEFVARYWLNKSMNNSLELVVQTETDQAQVALLLLAYGQLLISCKLKSAFEFLDRGLLHAANFLSPSDYFKVVNRHELLSALPLFADPRPAADLLSLENEAQILMRLKKGQPRLTGNFGRTPQR
jgi:hypothetical protein